MRLRSISLIAGAAMTLAACGDTAIEQGLVGLGAGAGLASITGGDWATGALLGAAGNVAYCQVYDRDCAPLLR
ncbi:MAG: hypothetical protein AAF748_15310 [Pseudomonadota bacterium]